MSATMNEMTGVDVFDPAEYKPGKRIRASSLPRIMACPASLKAPEIVIDSKDETADMGTAVHAVLADVITQNLGILPALSPYALRYGVEEDELRFLAYRGMAVWNEFKTALDYQTVQAEQEFILPFADGYELSGHVDVAGKTDASTLVIIDWKTGYVERDYNDQLMAYAYLAYWSMFNDEPAEDSQFTFKIVTAYLRTGTWDTLVVTLADVLAFASRLKKLLDNTKDVYRPAVAICQFCPRSTECPARAQVVQSAIRNMWPIEYGAALDDRQKLASLYEQVQALKKVMKEYDDALRTVIHQSGPLALPDGRKVIIQEQTRDTIHFNMITANILQQHFNLDDTVDLLDKLGVGTVTVTKKPLLDAVAADAPRGQKTAAKEMVMADLVNAGCVSTTHFPKLAAVKMLAEHAEGGK